MANLMNRQKQILVRRRANHIRSAPHPPAPEWCVAEGVCGEDLDGDDEQDEVFC
jgi:hypothetical protein